MSKKKLLIVLLIILSVVCFILPLNTEEEETAKKTETQYSSNDLQNISVLGMKGRPAIYDTYLVEDIEERLNNGQTLELNLEQQEWFSKTVNNPSSKQSALFYGTPGTGKTSLARKLAVECGLKLIVITSDNLSTIYNEKRKARDKFESTLKAIENENPDGDFIVLIEEADQVQEDGMDTKLNFLKGIWENVDPEKNPKNCFILTTNHLNKVDKAIYRPGRLNLINFDWNWNQLKTNSEKCGINWPQRYKEMSTLPPEKNQFVSKFSFDVLNPTDPEKAFWKKKSFLTYWNKFNAYKGEENNFDKIELEDFLNFFWDLRDSGDIENWDGKFTFKRKGTINEILNGRLQEIKNQAEEIKEQLLKGDKAIMDLESVKTDIINLEQNLRNLSDGITKINEKVFPTSSSNPQTRIIGPNARKSINYKLNFLKTALSHFSFYIQNQKYEKEQEEMGQTLSTLFSVAHLPFLNYLPIPGISESFDYLLAKEYFFSLKKIKVDENTEVEISCDDLEKITKIIEEQIKKLENLTNSNI